MGDLAPFPFPTRPLDAHKGTVGHVLVVGGSRGKTGAAFLAGKGALRSGAGLVTIACPASANAALEVKTTCVMTEPVPETEAGTVGRASLEPLRALAEGKAALALGPGLSRHPEAEEMVRALVEGHAGPPLVIDADGLNAFEGRADSLRGLAGRAVLTPHPGEFRRLSGEAATPERREEALLAFVARVGVVTLLKGHRTLVAEPGPADAGPAEGGGDAGGGDDRPGGVRPSDAGAGDAGAAAPRGGRLYVNTTGNPGMASGGTGDVLTGVIAGLLAQGMAPFEAACLGAYLHGRAGDLAARRTGWAPLIATDLLDGLIEAIRAEEVRG